MTRECSHESDTTHLLGPPRNVALSERVEGTLLHQMIRVYCAREAPRLSGSQMVVVLSLTAAFGREVQDRAPVARARSATRHSERKQVRVGNIGPTYTYLPM